MKLLSSLVLLCLCGKCVPFPQCCRQTNYYDFMFRLKCDFPLCKSNDKVLGNICIISCGPRIPAINQNSLNSSNGFRISQPHKLCQGIDSLNRTESGRLVLSWSWQEEVDSLHLFLIEARNYSRHVGDWGIVGMTNQTFAEITGLDLQLEYQFRVTPVISANAILLPTSSNWTNLLDLSSGLSRPTNLSISEFHVKENLVEATVRWISSKELPCSYKIFWMPAMGSDYFEQKTIVLPDDDLCAVLPGLMFGTNYTVTITPTSRDVRKVDSSEVWFITPTCLVITGSNFSLCAPGPPLNVSAHWSAEEAVVTWMPPKNTSPTNAVSGYHISVVESIDNFQIMQNIAFKSVEKDSLYTTFKNLNPDSYYAFGIRAVSEGGTGNPAVAELNVRELSSTNMPTPPLPYVYIVPILIPILAGIVIAVWRNLYSKRASYNKGCPSGVADVDDYLRPFLIPEEKIELQEIIGEGAFGIVHRAIYTRGKSKEEVAVKVFPSETITRRQLLYEVELMCIVRRHEQIVGLHGFTLDVEKMYLILEYCPMGDLHSYLVHLKPELMHMKSLPISERMNSITEKDREYGKQLCCYIYQVAQGMEYIASLKLIHRDLAARNILMQSMSRVKIGDFGLSKDVYETNIYNGKTQKKLPIKWMAPEAIEKQKFSTFTDVWSFGILMWEVFKLGKEPYSGLQSSDMLQYLKAGCRLEKPHCSQEWYDLMLMCWQKSSRQRPLFRELVRRIGVIIDKMGLYVTIS